VIRAVDNFRRTAGLSCLAAALMATGCDMGGDTNSGSVEMAGAEGEGTPGAGDGYAAGGDGDSSLTAASGGQSVDTSAWVFPPPFYAAGDEPYWRLDLADEWFVFRRAGLPEIEAPIVQPDRVRGADLFETPPLIVSVKAGPCRSDAGVEGDAVVTVTFDGVDFGGCAFRGQSEADTADAAAIIEALPVVDACLLRLAQPAVVTGAYPRDEGRTAVTLRARNGVLFECAAEAQTGDIAFLDPVEPGAAGAWMNTQIRFLRDGVAPPPTCAGAEQVVSEGKVLGMMLPAKCRF